MAANHLKSGIGIKLCLGDNKIPCLLFADDYLIFSKTSFGVCSKLKSLLDDFCIVSGQMINFYKSSIVFSRNATTAQKQLVTGLLIIT